MWRKGLLGLCAAFFFGASTPASKLLLQHVDPVMLAGILFIGSAMGCNAWLMASKLARQKTKRNPGPRLRPGEWRYVAGTILFGGMGAPVFLMFGLAHASSFVGSLLLNLEGVFTALLACLVFKETYGRHLIWGLALILTGGSILAFSGDTSTSTTWAGVLGVAASCLCWAIDNNTTKRIVSLDPPEIASLKATVAVITNLGLGIALGGHFPSWLVILGGAVTGFFGYGLALIFFILSLKKVGTARTIAYFSTAPFVGAIASIIVFREHVTPIFIAAGVAMALGVWVHLAEPHHTSSAGIA